jgi:tetratricopeptide (TPR) repeat protein
MPRGSKKKQRKSRARKRKRARTKQRRESVAASVTESGPEGEKERSESPSVKEPRPAAAEETPAVPKRKRRTQVKPRTEEQQPDETISGTDSRRARVWPVILIVACGILAYISSFSGAFVFDDGQWIENNKDIRQLWPIWDHLTRGTRPLVDLSIAVNFHLGGLDPWGYHLFNLLVHILAALTLFGVVRRTLLSQRLRQSYGRSAHLVALVVAAIWVVHPLQTQSVTYIIQRAESMMGLFYLLTLYCVIRGVGSTRSTWWYLAAVVAGIMGMGSKPVMFTAPIVVLLYDRVFLSRSFADIVRQRWKLYLGLALGWLVLAATGTITSIIGSEQTDGVAGFGFRDYSPWEYLITQPGVILHYLKLSFWPHPLSFDYWWPLAKTPFAIIASGLVILALLVLTGWVLWRRQPLGFLGAWFFIILAPTSSIFPIKDIAVEHRMYLSLAAVVVLGVVAGYRLLLYVLNRLAWSASTQRIIIVGLPVILIMIFGYKTFERNKVYSNRTLIWSSVVASRPENPRGHLNYGGMLLENGKADKAILYYREALRIKPDYAEAHYNLACLLSDKGQRQEAERHYVEAIRLEPDHVNSHMNLGVLLVDQGKIDEGIAHYHKALQFRPDKVQVYVNLGKALRKKGLVDEAIRQYQKAIKIDPRLSKAHLNLGNIFMAKQAYAEAVEQYSKALEIDPRYINALVGKGKALRRQGKLDEALKCYTEVLQIDPKFYKAHYSMGLTLMAQGKLDEAAKAFREALRIKPDLAAARRSLNAVLVKQGKPPEP